MRTARPVAFLGTALVAGGLAFGAASPAMAATPPNIDTTYVAWFDVANDNWYPLSINDATTVVTDLLSTGLPSNIDNGDAFDDFFEDFAATYGGSTLDLSMDSETTDYVDYGLSTLESSWSADFGDGNVLTVDVVFEIQGNYARWTLSPSGLADASIELVGNLGSDGSGTQWTSVGSNAAVSTDGGQYDPVIGYWFEGPSMAVDGESDRGWVSFDFDAAGAATIVLALQGWQGYAVGGQCASAFDRAVDEMTARVPTLDTSFGEDIPPALECVDIAQPTEIVEGEDSLQELAVTAPAGLDTWWGPGYLDSDDLAWFAHGLPAGMGLTYDPATGTATLSGAATAPGIYEVQLVFFQDSDAGTFATNPVSAVFTVVVAAAEEDAVPGDEDEDEPTLPATGVDASSAAVAAAGLGLLGVLALLGRRLARRA